MNIKTLLISALFVLTSLSVQAKDANIFVSCGDGHLTFNIVQEDNQVYWALQNPKTNEHLEGIAEILGVKDGKLGAIQRFEQEDMMLVFVFSPSEGKVLLGSFDLKGKEKDKPVEFTCSFALNK